MDQKETQKAWVLFQGSDADSVGGANAIKTPILATLSAVSGTVTFGGFLVEALVFSLTQPASSTCLLSE